MGAGLNALRAFADGLRRVGRAPWVVAGAWLAIVIVSLPLSWPGATVLRFSVSMQPLDYRWFNLLSLPTGWSPLFTSLTGSRFTFESIGSGRGPFTVTDPWLQMAALQIAVTLFLEGGVFDRLARDRRVGASGFFAACGGHVGRFARLGLAAVPVTLLLFSSAPPLAAIVIVLLLLNPVLAYAKIRTVVEDRRSAAGAIGAAFRFVRRHPLDVFGLYLLNTLLFAAAFESHTAVISWLSAPPPAWLTSVYTLTTAAIGLQFAASQIALFQSTLAHAGYTATPPPRWPDSPAAEAIRLMD